MASLWVCKVTNGTFKKGAPHPRTFDLQHVAVIKKNMAQMENITLIGGKALVAMSPNDRVRTGKVLEVE